MNARSRPSRTAEAQREVGSRLRERVETMERAPSLDGPADALSAFARRAVPSGFVEAGLRGRWLGHSLHPLLTDFTEGAWIGASFLDLFGPPGSERAARRLLGFGLVTALGTYLSGLAELLGIDDERERRVAAVHTAAATAALVLYAASYAARVRGHRRVASRLGVGAGLVAFADGYVGGHLGHVRAVDVSRADRTHR